MLEVLLKVSEFSCGSVVEVDSWEEDSVPFSSSFFCFTLSTNFLSAVFLYPHLLFLLLISRIHHHRIYDVSMYSIPHLAVVCGPCFIMG